MTTGNLRKLTGLTLNIAETDDLFFSFLPWTVESLLKVLRMLYDESIVNEALDAPRSNYCSDISVLHTRPLNRSVYILTAKTGINLLKTLLLRLGFHGGRHRLQRAYDGCKTQKVVWKVADRVDLRRSVRSQ